MRGRKIGMNLKSLTIPDQLPELGAWLDNLLVSTELINTIVELEILAGDRLTKVQSLDGVLAGSKSTVYESGLSSVSESTLRSILRQPSLLLELQEQVMMHGGDYWQKKTDEAFDKTNSKSIFNPQGSEAPKDNDASSHLATPGKSQNNSHSGTWSQTKIFGAIAAMAAAILLMVLIPQFMGGGSSVASGDWGFAKSGLLDSNISESEMLDQLAKASAAWHNKTPQTSNELAERLREFDQGCRALLASNLPQLSPANRIAVHAACENCRTDIAAQLDALRNGADLTQTQTNSNAAIDKLTRSIERLG